MNYKVVVDAAHGGSDEGNIGNGLKEKNYTLLISEYINKRLNELNIPSILTRTTDENLSLDERIKIINDVYGKGTDVIVISNHLGNNITSGTEIIYALRNNSALSYLISKNLENYGLTVNKYYQLRDEENTSLDKEYLIKKTNNNQTIEIFYGSVNDYGDALNIKNNWKNYAEGVVKGITEYLNVNYIPINEEDYYIVKSGDSLYSIAKKYDTTVNELKSLNDLSSNLLSIGQLLKIPKQEKVSNIYQVLKGDSLYSIAKKYDTTVNELKSLNDLSSNLLSIGQTLKVPESSISNNVYIVQKGDNLYSIAKKYNTTVNVLKSLNDLSSNLLSIGQVLKLPIS